jgi:hypothetical protein
LGAINEVKDRNKKGQCLVHPSFESTELSREEKMGKNEIGGDKIV